MPWGGDIGGGGFHCGVRLKEKNILGAFSRPATTAAAAAAHSEGNTIRAGCAAATKTAAEQVYFYPFTREQHPVSMVVVSTGTQSQ